jgi:hypothetical protein
MNEDYTIVIDDLPPTRTQMITILNKRIRGKRLGADTPKGIEIDVKPEWKDILQKDGSILWEYEKLGWRVMWYNQNYRTKPTRSWLSFRNAQYKGDK